MKNFVGFVVSLMNSIAANSEWSVFKQVAEDIYTEYSVQKDWSYHSEVVIPSYVGDCIHSIIMQMCLVHSS